MAEYKYPFNLITEYVINGYGIDTSKAYVVEKIQAKDLIVPERIDLMAKWCYIDAYVRGINKDDAIALYEAHLDAFSRGSFIEPGNEKKNSLKKYLDTFDRLIEDIQNNGFDEKKSIIPVGRNGEILDGSHRVAIAAYFNQRVTVIRFPECQHDFGTSFFRANLLNSKYLNIMVSHYLRLKDNCYFACLWPVAYDLIDINSIKTILLEYGKVIYIQDILLNYAGLKSFMAQIYGHQTWVGSCENHFSGADSKATPCFAKGKPIKTIVFTANCLDDVLEIKEKIRSLSNLEKHSVHISDSIHESRQMADLLYNSNSVHHLNYGSPCSYMSIHKRMEEIKEKITINSMDDGRFIIDADSALEIYGLYQSAKMDYMTDYKTEEFCVSNTAGIQRVDNSYADCSINDLLYNPNNYFVYNGLKFVALLKICSLRESRNNKEDLSSVKFIRKFLKREKKSALFSEEKILAYERKHKMYGVGLLDKRQYIGMKMRNAIWHRNK